MKGLKILFTLALSGLVLHQHAKAEEGFVFTEEEVAAADQAAAAEEDRQEMAMITDARTYSMASFRDYSDILLQVNNCLQAIGREVDFVECSSSTCPAQHYDNTLANLIGKYAPVPGGTITKGPLSRALLDKARPVLPSGVYEQVLARIERIEALMAWFMGDFAKACQHYDANYFEELQKVARFKELAGAYVFRKIDKDYVSICERLDKDTIERRSERVVGAFNANPRSQAKHFIKRLGYSMTQDARNQWYNELVLGAPNGYLYNYLRIRESGSAFAPTPEGAELDNYECRFEYWTKDSVEGVGELGKNALGASGFSGAIASYDNLRTIMEESKDEVFIRVVNLYERTAKPQFFKMGNELYTFGDYLKTKLNFMKNMEYHKKASILERANAPLPKLKRDIHYIHDSARALNR